MLRRSLFMALATAMIVGFAACGGKEEAEEQVPAAGMAADTAVAADTTHAAADTTAAP